MGNCSSCHGALPQNKTSTKAHHHPSDPIHSSGMGQGASADRHGDWGRHPSVMGGSTHRVLAADYEVGRKLAAAQFGSIRMCTSRHTGERFACKSIHKARLWSNADMEDVRREVEVMKLVAGHPNIVDLEAVYEDDDCVHLVMELCAGGELFDYITENRRVSEHEAAGVCKTLMEVVRHCHARGVIHRDLKPENILLSKHKSLFPLKVADFGLAVIQAHRGERLSERAGSAYYTAPEVLEGDYGEEIDVWSAGVVVYILLSGVPPFWGETEEDVFAAIRGGQFDLASSPWPSLSPEVKDLLSRMICPDADRRYTPDQVLNHRWIKVHCGSEEAPLPFKGPCNCSLNDSNLSSEGEILYSPAIAEGSTEALAGSMQAYSKLRSSEILFKDDDDDNDDDDDDEDSMRVDPIFSKKSALDNGRLSWSSLDSPAPHGGHFATLGFNTEDYTPSSSFQESMPYKFQEDYTTITTTTATTTTTTRPCWGRWRMGAGDNVEGKYAKVEEMKRPGRVVWKNVGEGDGDKGSAKSIGCELGRLLFPSSPISFPLLHITSMLIPIPHPKKIALA